MNVIAKPANVKPRMNAIAKPANVKPRMNVIANNRRKRYR
jgi:hypothetical protein